MRKQMLVIAGVLILLGGCSLAPKYTRPAPPIPAQWPQGKAYKNIPAQPDAVIIPELYRQEFFADESLQKIIEMALVNNRDLRLAALNVEKARALYGVQRAELFPTVNAAGGGGKQRLSSDLSVPGESRTVEQYSINLGVAAWEIDFFGRIRSLKEQALEEYLATDEARRNVQIALVSEVAMAYLTLAADRENFKLARSTLETRQAAYDLIKRQYDVGIATELDLRRAQIPVDTSRGDVARYEQMVAQAQNALNLLAGSPVPEDILPADLSSVTPPKEIFPGLSSEALLRRPDIVAAEHRLKGAYAFIGAARAAFFPRISLTTSLGTASDELSGLFSSGSDTWNFAPQIVMPIFDARTWAALRVSKADRKIILTQYEKAIQTAFREVADALAVQGTIDQQVSAQRSLVDAVAETYRLSNKLYAKGIDSYLGVLDAQRSLFAAQQGLISLRLARLANQVRLYAVLGGGGEPPETPHNK
ncbi:outer membrane protein, multidrug efflux system [Desulfosarcina sp. BuS5]|uniref:efflux transporter outer membrane subunit n=1 Tax=Desulfosarcina sp. BuS5 TaxID=933262 RepID=UPI00048883E8|nr:efflux transporter outer membrane subunit [Desulfosarcina sp. BuS5]WDN87245.1 outer membrane protein, multidrug efflux system [Desulfosarcina sp. BuS5]